MLAWAGLLATLMVINAIWTGSGIQVATFGFAVLVILASALAAIARSRSALRPGPPEPPPPGRVQEVSDLSFGAVLAGLSVAAIVFGLVWGSWLFYVGGGLLVLALGRLAVELRSSARSRARLRAQRATLTSGDGSPS